jgi:class III poly(R)-hydroxyalkanoic acid synthase PhaE subunit
MAQNPFFDDNWLKLQRDYWDGMSKMGREAMNVAQGGAAAQPSMPEAWITAPWLKTVEQWWQSLSPSANDPAKAFMQRLMDQGQVYFGMVEQLTKGLTGESGNAWETLNKTFETMQQGFSGANLDGNDTFKRMLGFWEMPLDNWQRMMSSSSPMMPGDLLRNMPHGGGVGQLHEGLQRMLSAPGIGYTREEQAQYQGLMRAGLDYQRAFQEYSTFFNQLGLKALNQLRDVLQKKAEDGKSIDSARGLYDTWIGCCESVYEKEVATPEYARLHGQLVNAQMGLKQRLSVIVDESLGAMNMPTRGELRTLQDRMQETRRENKRLRHEMDQIQAKLATLTSPPSALQSRPPSSPQTTSTTTHSGSGGANTTTTTTTSTKKTTARRKPAAKPSTE